MPESSSLSYQTTMPEYPDVSYDAYKTNYLGGPFYYLGTEYNRAGYASSAWSRGLASYENWRANQLDSYNARMSAYNTWLSTGAGQRASAESGQYNPSYFNTNPSASPVDYQNAPEDTGFSEMAQGISGIFDFAKSIQGLLATHQNIVGAKLQNEGLALANEKASINNKFLEQILQNKVLFGRNQANNMGYQSAWRKNIVEQELGRRFGVPQLNPETGLIDGSHLSYADMDFNLHNADKAFSYQRNIADMGLIHASIRLRNAQTALAKADEKVKSFYFTEIIPLEQQIMQKRLTLMDKQGLFLDSQTAGQNMINAFQLDRQAIELKAKKFGLTHDQIRTVIEVVDALKDMYSFSAFTMM